MTQPPGHDAGTGTDLRANTSLRVDATLRAFEGEYLVVVSGDIDATSVEPLERIITTGFHTALLTIVRLDGVAVFGSAGSRLVDRLLGLADELRVDLSIEGVPNHVSRILSIVGVHDHRIVELPNEVAPLSPIVFDAVMAASVLRTREAICITTSDIDDPRIVFVNVAFTSLTGYRADEVLGRNPRLLHGGLTDRQVIERLKRTLHEGDDFEGETVNYRRDGTPFLMNWRIVPIGHGLQRFYLAVQRDGTRLHQLHRHVAARGQLTRIINTTERPASRDEVLEALGRAVETVIEAPAAAISAALTTADGEVVAANLEGSYTDAIEFSPQRTTTHDADGTVTLRLPFTVSAELTGHLLIANLHPDRARLLDVDHLIQLADDCIDPLLNASA